LNTGVASPPEIPAPDVTPPTAETPKQTFAIFLVGQCIAGHLEYNKEQARRGGLALRL
jgi:hypothetical protein